MPEAFSEHRSVALHGRRCRGIHPGSPIHTRRRRIRPSGTTPFDAGQVELAVGLDEVDARLTVKCTEVSSVIAHALVHASRSRDAAVAARASLVATNSEIIPKISPAVVIAGLTRSSGFSPYR